MLAISGQNFEVEMKQHMGLVRNRQEDQLLSAPALGLFAVADGMGGHQGGQLASNMAIMTLQGIVGGKSDAPLAEIGSQVSLRFSEAAKRSSCPNMGTTLSALLFRKPGVAEMLHWGDSRIYTLGANGKPQRLTTDHITRHGNQNLINRALMAKPHRADMMEIPAPHGSVFVICSDGFWETFGDDPHAWKAILEEPNGLQLAFPKIIERGANDNITALRITLL